MPAKKQITREAIIESALQMLRTTGINSINARSLAKEMGCSTQPIYLSFNGMDELKQVMLDEVTKVYQKYIDDEIKSNVYQAYKAMGMAYVRFAREEKEFFKYIFMRDRTGEVNDDGTREFREDIRPNLPDQSNDFDEDYKIHVNMWIYTHGIATMHATGFLTMSEEEISKMIDEVYESLNLEMRQKNEKI